MTNVAPHQPLRIEHARSTDNSKNFCHFKYFYTVACILQTSQSLLFTAFFREQALLCILKNATKGAF